MLVNSLKPDYLRDFQTPFKNETAIGSEHLFDLIDHYHDKIMIIDFYNKRGNHQQVIKDFKELINGDQKWYDNIVYVDVNADLKYEFYDALYDLSILTQPELHYPYYLVLKNGNGDMIRGEDSAQMIFDKVYEFLNAS